MNDNVTQPSSVSATDFIASVENKRRRADAEVLLEMFNRVTDMEPVMWGSSIIGYGSYAYTLANDKKASCLRLGFSPRKQNLTLYIMTGLHAQPELAEKLGKHKTSKACLYINKLDDVDLTILEAIISADLEEMNRKYPE